MRDWLLRDLQALATGGHQCVTAPKQRHFPPDIARIVTSEGNCLQRRGRLGSAVMRLPASLDTSGVLNHLKNCGVLDEDAASDRVVSALVVSAKRSIFCPQFDPHMLPCR
jgi:hypothetical protein